MYVSDTDNKRIQVLHPNLSFSHMIGEGVIHTPRGIATDSQDVLYICDDGVVHKVLSDGKMDKLIATCGNFDKPYAIAVDRHDMVYVVDVKENVVFVFDSNSENMCCYAPSQASPSGIAIDLKDNIFYTIRKL